MPSSTSPDSRRNDERAASNLAAGLPLDAERSAEGMDQIFGGCRRGDRQAQRLLYEHCHEAVFRLIVRMVGRQDAPDVLQQTFLQVFSKFEQFRGTARFETWLYRIAVNQCLQFRRHQRRRHNSMPAEEPADHAPEHTLRTQQQELMERALARLAPELRAAFVLKEVQGLSYREIAAALQIKEGTVGSRLNEARAQLRTFLRELDWNPDP